MPPFFIRGGANKNFRGKRKGREYGSKPNKFTKLTKSKVDLNEEILSEDEAVSDDQLLQNENTDDDNSEAFQDEETAQEKKVRLAQEYINEIKEQYEKENKEVDSDIIAQKLKDDLLEAKGQLHKKVADLYCEVDTSGICILKSKKIKKTITAAVVSSDGFIFASTKDPAIVKWNLTGKYIECILKSETMHSSDIYALAISSDDKFLASGDKMGVIKIWNASTLEFVHDFKKHRQAVTGLAFQIGASTLYSCSHDRMVMIWDLEYMTFVDHLGGHQDAITGVDTLTRQSCITSGGRDESLIIYIITEDKQLRFTARQTSIDGVKLVDEKTFLSYGQDGSLAIWSTIKRRPLSVVKNAHGFQEGCYGEANWVTAVAAMVNTDIVASGSVDGIIKLWKVSGQRDNKILEPMFSIPVKGIVNSLTFTSDGLHLIAGIGREHKLGRWFYIKEARNSVLVIPLKKR